MNSHNLGQKGEKIALDIVKKEHHTVLETNYRTKSGEIDIICLDKGTLVFIEVKTRSHDMFGRPSEAVNVRKLRRIIRTGSQFAQENGFEHYSMRIDVISIILSVDGEVNSVEHIVNVTM